MSNHWWIKGTQMGIGSVSGSTVSVITSTYAVRYWGVKLADDFTTDLTEESDLPSTYHRALLAGVIRNFAEDDDDYKKASYWREVYKELRREAKKEANTRKDGTAYDVLAEGY
jgi:hypothetical protein